MFGLILKKTYYKKRRELLSIISELRFELDMANTKADYTSKEALWMRLNSKSKYLKQQQQTILELRGQSATQATLLESYRVLNTDLEATLKQHLSS